MNVAFEIIIISGIILSCIGAIVSGLLYQSDVAYGFIYLFVILIFYLLGSLYENNYSIESLIHNYNLSDDDTLDYNLYISRDLDSRRCNLKGSYENGTLTRDTILSREEEVGEEEEEDFRWYEWYWVIFLLPYAFYLIHLYKDDSSKAVKPMLDKRDTHLLFGYTLFCIVIILIHFKWISDYFKNLRAEEKAAEKEDKIDKEYSTCKELLDDTNLDFIADWEETQQLSIQGKKYI